MKFRIASVEIDEKLVALSIVLLFSYAFYKHYELFTLVNFNWFKIPEPHEIYLKEYGSSHASVFSSHNETCILDACGTVPITLKKGENMLFFNCSPRIFNLTCGERRISFIPLNGSGVANVFFSFFYANRTLFINMWGEGHTRGYERALISVDGKKIAEPAYYISGPFNFTERYPISCGEHNVRVDFLGFQATEHVKADRSNSGFEILLVLLSLLFAFLLSSCFIELLFFSLVFTISSLTLNFHLSQFFPSTVVSLVSSASMVVLCYLILRRKR
ncbi:MAG: hypothetical protein QXP42_02930 [Candidatus Micrarchaeia archaeon]